MLPPMDGTLSHMRAVGAFSSSWKQGGLAKMAEDLTSFGERLQSRQTKKVRSFGDPDFELFLEKLKAFKDAHEVALFQDVAYNPRQALKNRKLSVAMADFITFQDDLLTHGYLGTYYSMSVDRFLFARRPYPLLLQADKISQEKKRRIGIPLEYDAKFMYVIGASIVLQQAINHEDVAPENGEFLILPTQKGFYTGFMTDSVYASSQHPLGMQMACVERRGFQIQRSGYNEPATDIQPRRIVHLRHAKGIHDCPPHLKAMREGLADTLRPAHESGLLVKICKNYVAGDAFPLKPEEKRTFDELLTRVRTIVQGPTWTRSANFVRKLRAS